MKRVREKCFLYYVSHKIMMTNVHRARQVLYRLLPHGNSFSIVINLHLLPADSSVYAIVTPLGVNDARLPRFSHPSHVGGDKSGGDGLL